MEKHLFPANTDLGSTKDTWLFSIHFFISLKISLVIYTRHANVYFSIWGFFSNCIKSDKKSNASSSAKHCNTEFKKIYKYYIYQLIYIRKYT
jgi:hypothetical protein